MGKGRTGGNSATVAGAGAPATLSTAAQGMLLQGGLARERLQAKLLKQQQRAEQGVAGESKLQQQKRSNGSEIDTSRWSNRNHVASKANMLP